MPILERAQAALSNIK